VETRHAKAPPRVKRHFLRLLAAARQPAGAVPPHADPQAAERRLAQLVGNADALRDSGNPASAAAAYREALALAPGRSDLRVQLGNMLKDSQAFAGAEAAYREALAQSDQADTHLQLGHLLKAMGDRGGALAEYRRALELDPDLPGAAQELAEAGDAGQGRRRFDAELRGGGVEALLTLGDAISRMRADLDRLASLLPEARARTAFPTAAYDSFRDVFPIPAPPGISGLAFHIVLLAEREDLPTLFAQIGAIQAQSFGTWTLSVLGHSPDRQRVAALAGTADQRVRWVGTQPGAGPAQSEGRCAGAVADEWLLLLAAGAMLDPQALAWFAAAAGWSGAAAFVSDEEAGIRQRGHVERSTPVLRQVVDFDSLLQANVYGETIALRGEVYRAALPSLPQGSVAAARTALLLRLASAGQVGHVPYPLVWRRAPGPAVAAEHHEGVKAYLAAAGLGGQIEPVPGGNPRWHSLQPTAPLAVIIPTRDNAADLHEMVSSLRQTAAVPDALEIIVIDNGSSRPADLDTLRQMATGGARLLRRDQPFNWSHLNNEGAALVQAPVLVFANDDMRMLSAGWDARLRGLLERPEVGAVGARLLYDDDTVQHAGVLFGWKGSVIHDGLFAASDEPGPTCRWQLTHAMGAVTGAFLAIRRDRFVELGGFDAEGLPVAYADIDLCLALRAAGLKVLWTPAITLYHHESKTRGLDHVDSWRAARNAQERAVMEARWGAALDHDPGVHPCWHAAIQPFRLLAAASGGRVREHIVRTGSSTPWAVPAPATIRRASPWLR
jgi:GT2 family glycosyltransferase/tetratricopeptide (TPR) repeat protein